MNGYRVIESNEALGTMRYRGDYLSRATAEERCREILGDPARHRRFYALLIEGPDRTRVEVARGSA